MPVFIATLIVMVGAGLIIRNIRFAGNLADGSIDDFMGHGCKI
jgi:hypothetical protein